jgi:hypothetical protein
MELWALTLYLGSWMAWSTHSVPFRFAGGVVTSRAVEKVFLTIAIIAVVALALVQMARAAGYLPDRNLYLTLNIALPVLCFSMAYQAYSRRKQSHKP